jgi:hypothetical protein
MGTGSSRINGSSGRSKGGSVFLASKIVWAGIAFTLLTTGMLVQRFFRSAAGSDSNKGHLAHFVTPNEIREMQEALRNKGYYKGKVDGVFGLKTRDSIRAYQRAENLPITGQVDTRTADEIGLRPGSDWGNSRRAGREVQYGSDRAGVETKRDKPSAGIRWPQGRASKTSRKEIPRDN